MPTGGTPTTSRDSRIEAQKPSSAVDQAASTSGRRGRRSRPTRATTQMTPKSTAPSHRGGSPAPVSRPSSSCQTAGAAGTDAAAASGPTRKPAGSRDHTRPPGQQHQQRQAEGDPDPPDLARGPAQPHGRDAADQQRHRQDRRLEGREDDQHDARAPTATPGLGHARPAQRHRPYGQHEQRQQQREHTQRQPTLVRAAEPDREQARSSPRPTAGPVGPRSPSATPDRPRSARAAPLRTARR